MASLSCPTLTTIIQTRQASGHALSGVQAEGTDP